MGMNEKDQLLGAWDWEAQQTIALLKALPENQYDFRPYAKGRSIGEMAWHLCEVEAYLTHGIEQGKVDFEQKLPGLERPRAVRDLAPGYERVHRECVERVKKLKPEDFDKSIPFFGGQPMPVRQILMGAMLHHEIHHRGQLVLMCRLAGGTPPGIYGPTHEDMAKMMESAKARH